MSVFTRKPKYRHLTEEERQRLKELIDLEKGDNDLWDQKVRNLRSISLSVVIIVVSISFAFAYFFVPHEQGVKHTAGVVYRVFEACFVKKDIGRAVSLISKYFGVDSSSPVDKPAPSTSSVLSAEQEYYLAVQKHINEKLAVLNGGQNHISVADDVPFYWYSPRAGNSVERIAKKHGMFPHELIALNKFLESNPSHIEYGKRAPRVRVRAWRLYRMKKGDTFKTIVKDIQSEGMRMSVSYLNRVNPSLHGRVKVGEVMIIPCPLGQ